MNIPILMRYMSIFKEPPEVTIDDQTGSLLFGPFQISLEEDRFGIDVGGFKPVAMFELIVGTPDGGVRTMERDESFETIAARSAAVYAAWLLSQLYCEDKGKNFADNAMMGGDGI